MTRAGHIRSRRSPRAAFTLIELLVVIAIIALLIGITLPALARARAAGRLAVSLSNTKQIMLAVESYRFDHDHMPMRASYYSTAVVPSAWDTWAFGGKNNDQWWATYHDGLFDEPAFTRPLNPYLYSDLKIPEPIGYQRDPYIKGVVAPGDREILEMPVFRSPGDERSHQRALYAGETDAYSSYEEVGTSYHVNMQWLEELRKTSPTFVAAYESGLKRMRTDSTLSPARFVWLEDQFGRLIQDLPDGPAGEGWLGEFGGRNRSVSAFLDGHCDYLERVPGEPHGPDYSLEFDIKRR